MAANRAQIEEKTEFFRPYARPSLGANGAQYNSQIDIVQVCRRLVARSSEERKQSLRRENKKSFHGRKRRVVSNRSCKTLGQHVMFVGTKITCAQIVRVYKNLGFARKTLGRKTHR